MYTFGKEALEGIQYGLVRKGSEVTVDSLMHQWGLESADVIYDALRFNKAKAEEQFSRGGGRMLYQGAMLGQAREIGRRITSEMKSWAGKVDQFLAGKTATGSMLRFGSTPEVLKALGVKDLPLLMRQRVLAKVMGEGEKQHAMPPDVMKNLPAMLAEPVAVFRSGEKATAKGMVMLTEGVDADKNPVLVAVHLGVREGALEFNDIASVYGKENFEGWIKRQVGERNVLYLEKKKTAAILEDMSGPQLAGVLKARLNSGKKLYTEGDVVKPVLGMGEESLKQDAAPGESRYSDKLARESGPRAGIQFLDDGRAIIHLFRTADASSIIHEVGHLLRPLVPQADHAAYFAFCGTLGYQTGMTLSPARTAPQGLSLLEDGPGALTLAFTHDLDSRTVAALWAPAHAALGQAGLASLRLDVSGAGYMDGAGLALLVSLRRRAEGLGAAVQELGLTDRHAHLLELAGRAMPPAGEAADAGAEAGERRGLGRTLADGSRELLRNLRMVVGFVGESALVLYQSLRHPRSVRWKDVLLQALAVGVESMPILLLIGFLMGLIMSFQSVITLQRFGGEIYVPNMLGLVMFREMGPLVTAILLAARSGSAFAAEIGTMRVNEELDALSTMGISPVRFLVGPRILSSLVVAPFMTLFFNFASLVGGALVMLSIGFPLVTFTSRVFANVKGTDLVGSLVKIVVFSLLVTGVSCLRGLRTGGGASAVGRSTTAAVVSGLILITIADGLFAVLFYYFKI